MKSGHLKRVYRLISDSEITLGVDLTDEMLFHLTARFLLYVRRIQTGQFISIDEDERNVRGGNQSTKLPQGLPKVLAKCLASPSRTKRFATLRCIYWEPGLTGWNR